MQKCAVLMKLDYGVQEISNVTGELSTNYPSQILIPDYELRPNGGAGLQSHLGNGATTSQRPSTIYESASDPAKLRDLINKARNAR